MELRLRVKRDVGRNERGQFTSAGLSASYARNRRAAEVLRADLGQAIQAHVAGGRWAAYSTNRLARASADERNSSVEPFFVGVGNPAFLDQSIAKYWRTFEYGSAAVWKRPFIGTQLKPVSAARFGTPLHTVTDKTRNGERWRNTGKFVVSKEIDPAGIYAELARDVRFDELALQMAREYLSTVLGT